MENSLLLSRVQDTAQLCEHNCAPRFLGFLSPAEAAIADGALRRMGARYCFDGGYEGAERTVLCCLPDWCEETQPPVTAVTFRFRACDSLCHRDFLGTLMALGITRESVGDILCEPGRAVAFVRSEIASFVLTQITTVGRVGVTVTEGVNLPLPSAGEEIECTDTVASCRLDCVIGALCGCSRNQAAQAIADGRVSVNSFEVQKVTHTVTAGDRISVRGKGRFRVTELSEQTKKGRIVLKYCKFCDQNVKKG